MTIEEEFFEIFEIEKIEPTGNAICCMPSQNCTNCIEKECVKLVFPPITPEIVLELEDIIIKKFGSLSYQLNVMWLISVNDFFENIGETRKDALLLMCINLKDEIQEQVREVLNVR